MTLETGFTIDGCKVIPQEGRIVGPNGACRVEPKAMAVLLELARHAPQLRTRQQVVQAVWPRGHVSDDVLTRCVAQLRRALGDQARPARLLETVPKRGYRLCVKPIALPTEGSEAPTTQAAPPAVARGTLVVLPLRHLSPTGQAYVADGVTELLIMRLCALRDVRVISRTTASRLAQADGGMVAIAQACRADWVVEGSVLQEGDRVQVVVQLIDAHTDVHLWAADFVRDLQDLLSLQNQIAAELAAAIRGQIGHVTWATGRAPSMSPEGVREYLHARQLMSRRTTAALRDAVRLFESVTASTPDFAEAWVALAECELMLAHYGAPDALQLIAGCHDDLEEAFRLDPDSPVACAARSSARLFFERDLDGAARDAERAVDLLPQHVMGLLAMANVCVVRGDFAAASSWIARAHEADPLDVGIAMNVGDHLLLQHRYHEAVQALREAVDIVADHRPSQLRLAWALALEGQGDAAVALLARIADAGRADGPWLEYAALVASACGQLEAAQRYEHALGNLARQMPVSAWSRARAAAAAGRIDDALRWLQKADQQKSSSMVFVQLTPAFDCLRGLRTFDDLAARAVPLSRMLGEMHPGRRPTPEQA